MTSGGATTALLHTPGGAGGIAVILLSGPRTRAILAEVFRPRASSQLPQKDGSVLCLGDIYDGTERLDEALVAASDRVAEINIHGGPRVAQRTLQLLSQAGAEIVADEPAAWMDLELWPLAAEGLENPAIGRELLECLPRAYTAAALAALCSQWRAGLSELAAGALSGSLAWDGKLADGLLAAAGRLGTMQRLLSPPEVVVAGPPNAGKSRLTNALVGRDVSIVTDAPGTTRDWVRELADLGGPAVWLTDTAGLWATADETDAEAVRRAWGRIEGAELVLAIMDAAEPPPKNDDHWARLTGGQKVLLVANKCDLAPAPADAMAVSAASGAGLDKLRRAIRARLGLDGVDSTAPAAFTQRQADCLRLVAQAIRQGERSAAEGALKQLLGR